MIVTTDGGANWKPLAAKVLPPALSSGGLRGQRHLPRRMEKKVSATVVMKQRVPDTVSFLPTVACAVVGRRARAPTRLIPEAELQAALKPIKSPFPPNFFSETNKRFAERLRGQ